MPSKRSKNQPPKVAKIKVSLPKKSEFLEEGEVLTTNQGLTLSDNHNSLKAGPRGPSLLEDFVLREKITSFDHERIPERAVHARGAGAFGYFQCTEDMSRFTAAGLFTNPGKKTPVLVRFSTVAGSRGSMDTARDVRGFAVKFYTDEGNYDLVGNNIPVFFIQDAMKFPDLIHAAKPEQDLEIPQAQTAHDTFWDFISLMPESLHMVYWAMSDRAIPRSYRMMEGFGVHTFRFVNDEGISTFVKFHWKPVLGVHSLPWEESQQLGGLDPDYHRKDLYEAIKSGNFPEYELGVQLVAEEDEFKFPFDLLDPTKLIPEDLVPVRIIGKMVLDRNPDNFFSEIEQAAFHPGHLVPGIDLTNDPLLQGRLFSYTDTQITRLGGPNFHELPVNRPLASVHNNQRDGFGRQLIPKGNVAYEPNSLKKGGCPFHAGGDMQKFVHFDERISAHKVRARSSSFQDHISQAKLFYDSQSKVEQTHIKNAFAFELSKVKSPDVRSRMCNLMMFVNLEMAKEISEKVGGKLSQKSAIPPNAADPGNNIIPENRSLQAALEDDISLKPKVALPKYSKSLGIIVNNPKSVQSRKIALLTTSKADKKTLETAKDLFSKRGVQCELVIPKFSLGQDNDQLKNVEQCLSSTPSHSYDGVFVFANAEDYDDPKDLGAARRFIGQAFKHCKTIGGLQRSRELIGQATMDFHQNAPGVVIATKEFSGELINRFLTGLSEHRHWDREALVQSLPY